jgi:hypothetical protein
VKIRLVFRADERTDKQTDMTQIIVAFRNFAKAPKEGDASRTLKVCLPVMHGPTYELLILLFHSTDRTP